MSAAAIRALFRPGQLVSVTNHYISRPDHPCYGTNDRTVLKATGSHLWFDTGGNVPWPKAANLRVEDRTVTFHGFPNPGDLFLTIVLPKE